MTKKEMRTSLKLINDYLKKEYDNINEITIVDYEPLISDYTIRFSISTNNDPIFSERHRISNRLTSIFNTFGYEINCEVVFQRRINLTLNFNDMYYYKIKKED
jgi:hypothetical protein